MDTAYNFPFESYLIINPDTQNLRKDLGPWYNQVPEHISDSNGTTIEENDELDLFFNSSDPNARLYLDALECCPISSRIAVDDEGLVYCTPSDEILKIYRSNLSYDALRVDTLQISVMCNSKVFVSFLHVVPKQLSNQEWTIMRDDLEKEINGLAQDIVRRNIGLGDDSKGILPPDELYAFLVINRNAKAIMSALLDIKERPKYALRKRYDLSDESTNKEIDAETVKRYLKRGFQNNKLLVPKREVIYDIPENRLLKKIVKTYDEKLTRFIDVISETLSYRRQRASKHSFNSIYESKYIEGLEQYQDTAEKLKKITNIIRSADWFSDVKNPESTFVPHSFAVDSRYGTLFRMYTEMNRPSYEVRLDPQYSYSWKKSSSLYEMWCYIYICRYFLRSYSSAETPFDTIFLTDQLFPFLESGTKLTLENDQTVIEIVYDVILPQKSSKIEKYKKPLYITGITGGHNRPDICINVYSKLSGWYIGSFVVECKYRKLTAFWTGQTRSSKEQIIAYHNDSKSPLFFDGYLDPITSTRPVHQVFVLTPDVFEAKTYPDDKVRLMTFKPSDDQKYTNEVCKQLGTSINEQIQSADSFFTRINRV